MRVLRRLPAGTDDCYAERDVAAAAYIFRFDGWEWCVTEELAESFRGRRELAAVHAMQAAVNQCITARHELHGERLTGQGLQAECEAQAWKLRELAREVYQHTSSSGPFDGELLEAMLQAARCANEVAEEMATASALLSDSTAPAKTCFSCRFWSSQAKDMRRSVQDGHCWQLGHERSGEHAACQSFAGRSV